MARQALPAKEKHLYRYKPENRLQALTRYYSAAQRVALEVNGQAALALLIEAGESLPYSAFEARKRMLAVYGFGDGSWAPKDVPALLGTLTVEQLDEIARGEGTVIEDVGLRGQQTDLDARTVEQLRGLVSGRHLTARTRLSPFAA